MLGISTPLKYAEKIKTKLNSLGIYNRDFKPIKTNTHIIFPLLSKSSIKNTELVEETFEKSKISAKNSINSTTNIPSSYDIIGDIIIIELNEEQQKQEKKIAQTLLETHKQVKTILKKRGQHSGEFRTQQLKYLAGEKTKETIYKENKTQLKLEVEQVYFSSRLSTERKRIFLQIKNPENILVMFSGCGPYPLTISKNTKAKKIIGIEKNPIAHKYAKKNILLNKVKNVEFICGDVRTEVPKLNEKFDRIIMPLPKDADTFLDTALLVAKKGTIIHLYDFEHETEFDKVKVKIKNAVEKAKVKYKILDVVKCGQYSPGKFRICADFIIK